MNSIVARGYRKTTVYVAVVFVFSFLSIISIFLFNISQFLYFFLSCKRVSTMNLFSFPWKCNQHNWFLCLHFSFILWAKMMILIIICFIIYFASLCALKTTDVNIYVLSLILFLTYIFLVFRVCISINVKGTLCYKNKIYSISEPVKYLK